MVLWFAALADHPELAAHLASYLCKPPSCDAIALRRVAKLYVRLAGTSKANRAIFIGFQISTGLDLWEGLLEENRRTAEDQARRRRDLLVHWGRWHPGLAEGPFGRRR